MPRGQTAQADAPTKVIEFDGQQHEFPADFTDDDIRKALSSIKPAVTPKAATEPSDSVLGGFGRRAAGAFKGLTAPPQSLDEQIAGPLVLPYRMAKSAIGSEVKAGKQAVQYKDAATKDIGAGDYKGALGDTMRAGVTGAAMLNPFATGTVADVNELQDQGRTREAIGAGAFDALTLLIGGMIGRIPSARTQLSNLVGAVGETGDTARNLKPVMSDLADTAKQSGKPSTIGDLKDILSDTKDRIDAEYNQKLFPIRGNKVIPSDIATRIRKLITPDMAQTAEGRETAKYIEKRAREYDKPWSLNELNSKRMTENANIKGYYNKGGSAQNAALRSNEDMAISKSIRDGAANIVTDEIDRAHPGTNAQALKTKQGHLIELNDQLDKHIGDLEDKQLASESKTLSEKLRPRAYVGEGGPRAYISRVGESLPGGGPEKAANVKVRRAFGPSNAATARRATVLALPVTHLTQKPTAKGLPPPPEPTQ